MCHLTRRRAVHGLLFMLFVPTGTACKWKHYELAPAPAADGVSSDGVSSPTVRIIKRDGSQLTLRAAQLRGDTLHGLLANVPRDAPRGVVARHDCRRARGAGAEVQRPRASVLHPARGAAPVVRPANPNHLDLFWYGALRLLRAISHDEDHPFPPAPGVVMSHLTPRRTVHGLLFVLLVSTGTACTSWNTVRLAPVQASDSAHWRTVRIVTRTGSQLTLRDAQLRGDILHASLANGSRGVQARTIALPKADVADARVRKVSTGKTLGLLAGAFVGVMAAVVFVAVATVGVGVGY